MTYKTDLHCHTSELSGCSSESASDTVKRYAELGYSSVVITNHFRDHGRKKSGLHYKDYVDLHFEVAERAGREAAGKLHVIPGMELCLNSSANDYLIFGATREIMKGIPDIFRMELSDVHDYLSANGCLLIQAHPLRWGMTLIKPQHIDGYEVLNTHEYHQNHNDVVMLLAKSIGGEGKIYTAGTDHHDACQNPSSGIMTAEPIVNSAQLVQILKEGRYHIFG